MLKVLQIIPSLEIIGGAERLLTDLSTNINSKKFLITVVTFFSNNNDIFLKQLKENNIKVITLNKKRGIDLKIIFKLYNVFKEYNPDVINTHLYAIPYVLIPAFIRKIKVKVHTVHSIASKEISGRFKKAIMKIAYKYFGFIPIGISDYVKESIQKEYKLDENKIECIYNGIDTGKFTYKNYNKNDNFFNFINVGRLGEEKNHILLIEAFSLVKKDISNAKLYIVGEGQLRKKIENKIQELNLQDDVILRGKRENINRELNNASVFVLSSNYEGLPLSVLEAMACGLPIISTDAGGVVDIVKNRVNGLIVEKQNKEELANAMKKMCNNKLIQDMSIKSYELSRKYDIKKVAESYENLYIRLLKIREDKNED